MKIFSTYYQSVLASFSIPQEKSQPRIGYIVCRLSSSNWKAVSASSFSFSVLELLLLLYRVSTRLSPPLLSLFQLFILLRLPHTPLFGNLLLHIILHLLCSEIYEISFAVMLLFCRQHNFQSRRRCCRCRRRCQRHCCSTLLGTEIFTKRFTLDA